MKPAFQKDSEFSRELKKSVREYLAFSPSGKFADAGVWLKAAILIGASGFLYFNLVFGSMEFFSRALLTVLFAFSTLLLGLNVMHEAAHGNYSSKPWVNRLFALSFDVYGISSDLYSIKHTQFHHNYTNLFEHDADINETPLIRMSRQQAWKSVHRYQAFYTPILYSLITITWPLNDLVRLATAKVGKHTFRRPPPLVVVKILLFKLISMTLTYWLPIRMLGLGPALFLILLFHLLVGIVLALVFQVAHVHEDGNPSQLAGKNDWFIHQLQTSADFSTESPAFNWMAGGLNFQVIHHLFPNVSYRHYPAIQKIAKELCRKHGLRYLEFPTFAVAVRNHFEWLKQLAVRE